MADLNLRRVSKRFGDVTAVAEIDLEIAHREFVVIVGPSGCGKSTLLRVIAGLEELTTGEIHVGGEPVHRTPPAKRGIAMVFQNYALYPHKTVAGNMGFALRMAKVPGPEIERRVIEAARILQIEDLLERKPRQLSGGQRQRVAIGRAIVREPKVFLFDEPLSNLDAALRVDMRVELARLHGSIDATMVYVTHDQTEAMTMADKIVVLREGRIEQVGSPMTIYHHPANVFVAGFIGSPRMNLLPGTVRATADGAVTVDVAGGLRITVPAEATGIAAGDPVTLGVRPEDLAIGPDPQGTAFDLDVYVIEPLGGETILYGQIGGQIEERIEEHDAGRLEDRAGGARTLVVKTQGGATVRNRQRVPVRVVPEVCHLFDRAGVALPRPAGAGDVTPPETEAEEPERMQGEKLR